MRSPFWIAAFIAAGALTACGSSGPSANTSTGSESASSSGGSTGSGNSTGSSAARTGTTTGAPLPPTVNAQTVGLLMNPQDPQSVAVANAYQAARDIPAANVFALGFTPTRSALDVDTFSALKAALDGDAGTSLQAYAISWTFPYAVRDYDAGCTMSITSAFALGFDMKWCTHDFSDGGTCQPTALDPYYASKTTSPFTTYGIRPTMMLAGADAGAAMAVIQRGVASDGTFPKGNADLVITTDSTRSVREAEFHQLAKTWDGGHGVFVDVIDNSKSTVDNGALEDAGSVLFYLTGLANVPKLASNAYLDGAVGDSLTSFGGVLSGAGQTTTLDWLYAGLTGSYGTVHEPCNFTTKFSDPTVLVPDYVAGQTLVEAYWKAVACPGEGLFTGDPLARPWGDK